MNFDAGLRLSMAFAFALGGAAAAADSLPETGEASLFADIPSVFGASKYEQRLSEGHNRLYYPEFDAPATNNGDATPGNIGPAGFRHAPIRFR